MIGDLAVYLALGAVAGTLAGLLGVGGGLVIVPALAWVFARSGFDQAILMHLAIGTSLATIVLTSVSSVRAHHRHGAVEWPIFTRLTPGIVFGAAFGAWIVDVLPTTTLKVIFGLFALAVAVQMGFGRPPAPHRGLPGPGGLGMAGGVIGAVSAVVGIGGGSLTVPFLTYCNRPVRQAVATSAACGLPIAVAGALSFMFTGWQRPELPAGTTGYVFWPAFGGIVVASMLFAPLGASLAHRMSTTLLKRFFALFLALVGLRMMWSVISA